MAVAVAPAEVRRRARLCCRCGQSPRHGDTYLCPECHVSAAKQAEIDDAMQADPNHPRLALMQRHNWRGGWGRTEVAS